MKTQIFLILPVIFLILLIVMVFPFLPFAYDPLSIPLAVIVQQYSGLGLLTTIPAMLWLLRNIKYPSNVVPNDSLLLKRRVYVKLYYWFCFAVLLIITLQTTFGISILAGITLFILLIYFSRRFYRKILNAKSELFSLHLPSLLALLPAVLFIIQLSIGKPITNWSRNRAIQNSRELIDEIERYKIRQGTYPLSLNAIHKDYLPGIAGIEKYHYTYDNTSYNIYFEQPRFFFDRLGTREFVVYNPQDHHMMMSHTAWHLLFEPSQRSSNQGSYETVETGIPHWKSFLFD